jgi:hypothetical protein
MNLIYKKLSEGCLVMVQIPITRPHCIQMPMGFFYGTEEVFNIKNVWS